jgi:hypothetical protein
LADFGKEGLWGQERAKKSEKMEIEDTGKGHGGRKPRAN